MLTCYDKCARLSSVLYSTECHDYIHGNQNVLWMVDLRYQVVVVVVILNRECECADGRQDFELLLVDAGWIVYIHLRVDSGGSAYVHVAVTYFALGRRQDERDGRAVGSEGSM